MMDWAHATYGALLRCYPETFRTQFGEAMRETFLLDLARVKARGIGALISFWIITIAQAVWFGSAERRGSSSPQPDGPRWRWNLGGDIRYALRLLARSPMFTATSIASLALGLAAATVIFGLADALLLQGSPGIRDPKRVVDVGRTTSGAGFDNTSYPALRYLATHTRTLSGLAAATFGPSPVSLTENGTSERVFGQLVTANYFDVLGVQPATGRLFLPDEDRLPDNNPVVVFSHAFWQTRFGGDPSIVNRIVTLNNRPYTVVGVAQPEFEGATLVGTDLWVPTSMVSQLRGGMGGTLLNSPRSVWITGIGRLADGQTPASATAELNSLFAAFRAANPGVSEQHGIAVVETARVPSGLRAPFTTFIALLFVLAAGLLTIASSNVAGMLLARATARRREMATRLAIGASRGQVIAQLLTETVVLFVLAVAAAAPLAWVFMGLLRSMLPTLPVPLHVELVVSTREVLFACAMALATGLLFGLVPARHALKTDVFPLLHGHSSTATRDRLRFRHGLVVTQVALSLAMIITAGLFVRTLLAASKIDPGFRTANISTFEVDTTLVRAEDQAAVTVIDRVVDRVRSTAGVTHVAHARMVPLQGGGLSLGGIRIPGLPEATANFIGGANWDVISPDYFRVLDMPIVSGRAFTHDDRADRPRVAIVNETFARAAWPGQSAVGQRFWQTDGEADQGVPVEVVGVARDAKYRYLSEPATPFVYVPFAQQPMSAATLLVRHDQGEVTGATVREAIAAAEPGLPVVVSQSLEEATAIGLLPQRVAAWVAGLVGLFGLFLAALGLYGLTAFLVEQRTREIAIRMALGATYGEVRTMVLGRSARLAALGTVLGLGAATALGLAIESLSLLVEVRPTDPLTFLGLSVFMALLLFVASDVPARRAVRTNPAALLKAE